VKGVWRICVFALVFAISLPAAGPVGGKVVTETSAPLSAARVLLDCAGKKFQSLTDPDGSFRFDVSTDGTCQISVVMDGYFPLNDRTVNAGDDLRLILTPIRERLESVEVSATPSAVDLTTVSSESRVSQVDIINAPYPATNNLFNAMRILPGVVKGTRDTLHINGGAAEQTQTTLDGFNISDPLTNGFNTRMSVESIESVEVTSGPMPPEFGKGSAGTLALRTRSGDDKFRASATNFIPGVEFRSGLVIGNFTPRVNFSGPWLRGRAWWSNSVDLLYDQTVVPELEGQQDRSSSWRWSDLFHNQINIKPSNILFINLLATYWYAPKSGLSALDPIETTVDRRARQWFFSIKDQAYLGRGALLEFGFASNRTHGREVPQGSEFLLYTPLGKRGNWWRDANQSSGRDQVSVAGFLPTFNWKGAHLIKIGTEVDRLDYWQDIHRTGFINLRADGVPLRKTVFEGNGILGRDNTEASLFVQDSWRVRPGLQIEGGFRWDWDQLIKHVNFAPRVAFAWSPGGHENTKISGGVGTIFDATPLALFVRPDDQYSLTTYFGPDGSPDRGPAVSLFLPPDARLRRPGFLTYSLGWERLFATAWSVKLNYLGKRGLRGLTYVNTLPDVAPPDLPNVAIDAVYRLTNARQDRYDGFEFTVRQNFHRQYQWMASYIRSSARSNNAVDLSIDEPNIVPDNSGPLAWDAPHRLISWGYLPTFWKNWAIAYLVEYHTGFPYSIISEDGRVLGAVNAQRLPDYFEANLHAEWKFAALHNRWAIRGGVNNITGRKNPVVVNNIVGTPDFGTFYGGYGSAINFRIRWLGKT
jgi:hypothetical protein